ncbi:hypothetical protein AB5I41_13065 [Sphingomonas sp. MMS24-JH45]
MKTAALTSDYGANLKWKASDRLSFNLDGRYVKSNADVLDFSVFGGTFGNVAVDTTGRRAQIEFLRPSGTGSNAAYFTIRARPTSAPPWIRCRTATAINTASAAMRPTPSTTTASSAR